MRDFRVKNSAITAEAAIRYEPKKGAAPLIYWHDPFAAGRNGSGPSLFLPVARRPGRMLGHCAGACDQDVNEAAGAGLPAGESRRVEDAHERTHEVDGGGVRTEITAGDGVLDGGHEGGVNERPGAFE